MNRKKYLESASELMTESPRSSYEERKMIFFARDAPRSLGRSDYCRRVHGIFVTELSESWERLLTCDPNRGSSNVVLGCSWRVQSRSLEEGFSSEEFV